MQIGNPTESPQNPDSQKRCNGLLMGVPYPIQPAKDFLNHTDIPMRIGIDFDDVVTDSIQIIIRLHNKHYGTDYRKDQMVHYKVQASWGGSKEEWRAKLDEFFSTKNLAYLDPVAGSLVSIQALRDEGHELYIVTGRGSAKDDVAATEQWLITHFPDVFKDVYYANHVAAEDESIIRREKSEICKENGIEILIDDNPRVATECAAAGIRVFLFDQPWNQGEFPANVERVHSWDEIVKKVSYHSPFFNK